MPAVQPEAQGPGLTAVHSQPTYGLEPVGKGQAAAGFRAVLAPGVAAVDGAGATVPASGAAGFVAALAAFLLGFAFFRADFFPAALFFAGFFNDLFLAFDALFFFFFFAAFLAFLFFAMTNLRQELMEQHTEPARRGAGYSTAGENPGPLNSFAVLVDRRS
jgi:hypothetical protein